jgi:hypothetical protein
LRVNIISAGHNFPIQGRDGEVNSRFRLYKDAMEADPHDDLFAYVFNKLIVETHGTQ